MPSTTLRAGEVLECSLWLSGTETPEQIKFWKDSICPTVMKQAGVGLDVTLGPVVFTEKLPGEDRVPDVPDHITGSAVKLLVAEAIVADVRPVVVAKSSFLADLDKQDLARLRALTRHASGSNLTDAQCDDIIERIGPQSATKALVASVESKMTH